jgi:hypothetical protein
VSEGAREGAATAKDGELDCRETADRYKDRNRIHLYTYSYCEGGNDAWSPAEDDPNYNDDKGPIRKFNNRTDSIVNTTKKHVAFYNEPNYEGDNFCLRPGNYIRRLYVYGDGGGTNDWWSNSISSHKLVDAGDCDRWFGWLVP